MMNTQPPHKTIHVACVADQRFYEGARISLISLVSCASGKADYGLHLFSNDMSEDSVRAIDTVCQRIAVIKGINITLTYHKVKEDEVKILPMRRGSHMAYLRLMIPQILSDVDDITYIDTDTLFIAGIEDIQLDLTQNSTLLTGARDFFNTLENECPWSEELQPQERLSPYINTGICQMNLAAMRKMELLSKALELLKSHPTPRFADQTLLNFLCRGRIAVFDSKYNFVINKRINLTLNKGDAVKNYHYIGKIKPWHGSPLLKKWLAVSYWHIASDIYSGGSGQIHFVRPPNILSTVLKFIFCGLGLTPSSRLYWADLHSLRDPSNSRSLIRKTLLNHFTQASSQSQAVAHD
jgi:lipopolysaccharide biosynthesis glycosyltransferase